VLQSGLTATQVQPHTKKNPVTVTQKKIQ